MAEKIKKALLIAALISSLTSCGLLKDPHGKQEARKAPAGHHPFMHGIKIFIDPGHGGSGGLDTFRTGPNGIREEEINLDVALKLADMLKDSGAEVLLSRDSDTDIEIDRRVIMARGFSPDLLVSIHHNGSVRREDGVNYPLVFIRGNRHMSPASYDFAALLLNEFEALTGAKGTVVSDFTVYRETGTRILRKTSDLCPGVIGEAAFFSDTDMSLRLALPEYRKDIARAYMKAVLRYFMKGLPRAEVVITSSFEDHPVQGKVLTDERPAIHIKTFSGTECPALLPGSFKASINGLPVKLEKTGEGIFRVNYGDRLYPGGHRLIFSFRNNSGQSSMILNAPFAVKIRPGDYAALIRAGRSSIAHKKTARAGALMLVSAWSMASTSPEAGELLYHISRGFRRAGDAESADFYLEKLMHFYPDSRYAVKAGRGPDFRVKDTVPAEHYGKRARVILKDSGSL